MADLAPQTLQKSQFSYGAVWTAMLARNFITTADMRMSTYDGPPAEIKLWWSPFPQDVYAGCRLIYFPMPAWSGKPGSVCYEAVLPPEVRVSFSA